MSINEAKLQEFLGHVVSDLSASYAGVMVSLGDKLGLYKAMAGAGPITSADLAAKSGCAERYVREWLNSQAAGGYVQYHAATNMYELPDEHAMVLAESDSPAFFPPAWDVAASMWLDEGKAIEAFKTGKGVPWHDHHERLFCGVAAFFRSSYRGSLVQSWIPALSGVDEKLKAGAKVADVGCGHGHSTLLMAKAYPNSRFWGFDSHNGSITTARELAQSQGLTRTVSFENATAKSLPPEGFDLICFFDCLHDMGDPVGAAKHALKALAKDGTVMLVEPFANDQVQDNLNPIGRLYYSASTTLCCAHSLSENVGLALGAQAGEAQLEAVFKEAGYGTFRCAAKTPFNLVLEAKA